jgi:hypothetical protein
MPNSRILSDDIVDLARRVITENAALGRKVTLAESCTGGLVCAALTEIAGSSAVLDRGFVTYSNESKQQIAGRGAKTSSTPSARFRSRLCLGHGAGRAQAAGPMSRWRSADRRPGRRQRPEAGRHGGLSPARCAAMDERRCRGKAT